MKKFPENQRYASSFPEISIVFVNRNNPNKILPAINNVDAKCTLQKAVYHFHHLEEINWTRACLPKKLDAAFEEESRTMAISFQDTLQATVQRFQCHPTTDETKATVNSSQSLSFH